MLGGGVIEQDGKRERVVPDAWFVQAGKASTIGGKRVDYGYLWWPLEQGDPIHEGAFEAEGIFGQYMYINPREKLVIVVLSARPKPNSDRSPVADDDFFAAVARALQ